METGITGLEGAYRYLLTGVLIVLALLLMLCLVRAIIGPRIADRIVAVNMMGTMVIVMIAILALMLGEGYLADICIIYACISFLAVIVLTKVYMGVYLEKTESHRTAQGHLAEEQEKGREVIRGHLAEEQEKDRGAVPDPIEEGKEVCRKAALESRKTGGKSHGSH